MAKAPHRGKQAMDVLRAAGVSFKDITEPNVIIMAEEKFPFEMASKGASN